MMRCFIDCEFNEFKGELISMAIVTDEGHEWYEVIECKNPGPWVAINVIPILNKKSVPREYFQASLQSWLMQFESIHLVADWPEDIKHFCEVLITGPGMRLNTPPLTMEVIRIDAESDLPHNALSDARGIRDCILALRTPNP